MLSIEKKNPFFELNFPFFKRLASNEHIKFNTLTKFDTIKISHGNFCTFINVLGNRKFKPRTNKLIKLLFNLEKNDVSIFYFEVMFDKRIRKKRLKKRSFLCRLNRFYLRYYSVLTRQIWNRLNAYSVVFLSVFQKNLKYFGVLMLKNGNKRHFIQYCIKNFV